MNLIELSYYLQNESAAQEYLQQQGVIQTFKNCIYCGSEKIGNIRRDRVQCYKCRKEWHRRKESFLEGKHISYAKFMGIIKFFSDEFGVYKTSTELQIDIKSVINIFEQLRARLFQFCDLSVDLNYSGSRYLFKNNLNKICFTNDASDPKLKDLCYCRLITIRKKSLDNSYSFDVELEWINRKDRSTIFHINRFLAYIKLKIALFRGLSYKNFNSFLYEMVIRSNLTDKNFMDFVLESISNKRGWLKLPDTSETIKQESKRMTKK